MKRWTLLFLAAAAAMPAAAQAQKRPSNNMHTRSADVYLSQAEQSRVTADRRELFQKALNAALEGAKVDPDNPKPWYQAGIAHLRLGNLAQADSALDRAESIYPAYAEDIDPERLNAWITFYNQGVQALQAGDLASSAAALEMADRIYRKRPEALVMLGSIHMQNGDLQRAERAFMDALAVLNSPHRAGLSAEEAASWAEDETTAALRLSTILADQGRNDEAIKLYRDLLASQPDNIMVQSNLALVLSRADREEEAIGVYRELLKRDDLGEATLYNIGVGLFRGEHYAESAEAFRRAAKINPYSHDTLYNLANALLAQTGELEKDRAANSARLNALYEEMRSTADRLHGLDPSNRTVLMLLAQSQRSLGEVSGKEAEWGQKVLQTLEKAEALQYDVSDIVLVPGTEEVQITGRITNLKAPAGTPVQLRFSIISLEGAELIAQEVTVNLAETEASTRFDMTIPVPEGATGWKYTVVGG